MYHEIISVVVIYSQRFARYLPFYFEVAIKDIQSENENYMMTTSVHTEQIEEHRSFNPEQAHSNLQN